MAKSLREILSGAEGVDPAVLQKLQAQARVLGIAKKVIHIELDLSTGNLKSQASPMDHVMHLGMLEFYRVTVIANMLNKPISKTDPETPPAGDPAPESQPAAASDTPAPEPEQAPAGDVPPLASEASSAAPEAAPAPAAAPDSAPAPVAAAVVDPKTEGGAPAA